MSRPPRTPSPDWKGDFSDILISFAIAVVMLLIGVSTGQVVFAFMAGAMVLIGGGEALRHRRRKPSLFLMWTGRVGMVASLAYAVSTLLFGGLQRGS